MNILSLRVVVVAEQVPLSEYKALARGRKLIVVRTNAAVSSGGWRKDAAAAGNEDDEVSQAKMERERDWWHLLAETKWPHRFCASACVCECVCVFAADESFTFLVRSFVLFQFQTEMMNFSVQSLSHGMDSGSCAATKKTGPNRNHDHNHVITQLWNYVRVANWIMYSSPFWADANHILGWKSLFGGN